MQTIHSERGQVMCSFELIDEGVHFGWSEQCEAALTGLIESERCGTVLLTVLLKSSFCRQILQITVQDIC